VQEQGLGLSLELEQVLLKDAQPVRQMANVKDVWLKVKSELVNLLDEPVKAKVVEPHVLELVLELPTDVVLVQHLVMAQLLQVLSEL
jgi:hypothetical protein